MGNYFSDFLAANNWKSTSGHFSSWLDEYTANPPVNDGVLTVSPFPSVGYESRHLASTPQPLVFTGSVVTLSFNITLPKNGAIATGEWDISGIPPGPQCSIVYGANSQLVGNGNYAMPAWVISALNNGDPLLFSYQYFQPSPMTVNLGAALWGDFPTPVKLQPTTTPAKMMDIMGVQKMPVSYNAPPLYIYSDISGWNFPVGYQLPLIDGINWMGITPGMVNFNGSNANDTVMMRIYNQQIGQSGTWTQNPTINGSPIQTQLMSMPTVIPWDSTQRFYCLVFYSLLTPAPSNSQVELILQGFYR